MNNWSIVLFLAKGHGNPPGISEDICRCKIIIFYFFVCNLLFSGKCFSLLHLRLYITKLLFRKKCRDRLSYLIYICRINDIPVFIQDMGAKTGKAVVFLLDGREKMDINIQENYPHEFRIKNQGSGNTHYFIPGKQVLIDIGDNGLLLFSCLSIIFFFAILFIWGVGQSLTFLSLPIKIGCIVFYPVNKSVRLKKYTGTKHIFIRFN